MQREVMIRWNERVQKKARVWEDDDEEEWKSTKATVEPGKEEGKGGKEGKGKRVRNWRMEK